MKVSKILAATLLAVSMGGPEAADEAPLRRRIADLEKRVAVLERQLEAILGKARWKAPVLWRRIEKEMSPDEIVSLLGRPARIEEQIFETWYYHPTSKLHSFVWFDAGRVLGWTGPD